LLRYPGTNAAANRSRHEVSQRFRGADALSFSQDRHLALQGIPGKQQTYLGGEGYLFGFSAVVVSEKYKTPFIEGLQQHRAATGPLAIASAKHHGVWFQQVGGSGLAKPAAELCHWIGIKIPAPQPVSAVIPPQLGDGRVAWGFHLAWLNHLMLPGPILAVSSGDPCGSLAPQGWRHPQRLRSQGPLRQEPLGRLLDYPPHQSHRRARSHC